MNFVGVDLGASETRFISDKSGGVANTVSNSVIFMEKEEGNKTVMDETITDFEDNDSDIYTALEVIIKKDKESTNFPMHVLAGEFALRYNSRSTSKPASFVIKRLQRINYFSAVLACAISKLQYNMENDIDFYMMLPPKEVKESIEMFSEELTGNFTVEFPKYKGGTTVKFSIKSVNIYPEGAMALLSFFYSVGNDITPKQENEKYKGKNILSLDIGSSTTDMIVRGSGNRFIDSTKVSIRIGGDLLVSTIKNELYSTIGDIDDYIVDTVVREGRIPRGISFDEEEGTRILIKAKRTVAKAIYTKIESMMSMSLPITSIAAVVISGGGNLESHYVDNDEVKVTTPPMSKYIAEEFHRVSPYTEVISVGDNPRMANIEGLYIFAIIDQTKKKQKTENN